MNTSHTVTVRIPSNSFRHLVVLVGGYSVESRLQDDALPGRGLVAVDFGETMGALYEL